jgi:short-chain Z-isoprenyl diphosphate synthase
MPVPQHVGLILDGNRRFAIEQGLETVAHGHQKGADKIDEVLNWCEELRIPMVTLWVLSTDNIGRDPKELGPLLQIIEGKIRDLGSHSDTHGRRTRITVLGRRDLLPESMRCAIEEAEAATAGYSDHYLNIAVGYGGREEVTDALRGYLESAGRSGKSITQAAADVSPEAIRQHLYAGDLPDPELVIRTSGEIRLSGFLLWQAAYSEFYFCDAYWPAFRKIDFLRAIRSYQARHRRFGR